MWWIPRALPAPASETAQNQLASRWWRTRVLLFLALVVIPLLLALGATVLVVMDVSHRGVQWSALLALIGAWIPVLVLHRSLNKKGLYDPSPWIIMAIFACTVQVFLGVSPAVIYQNTSLENPSFVIGFGLDAAAGLLAAAAMANLRSGKPIELAETPFTVTWKLRSKPSGTVDLDQDALSWRVSTPTFGQNTSSVGDKIPLSVLNAMPSSFAPSADRIQWANITYRLGQTAVYTTPGPAVLLRKKKHDQLLPLDEADQLLEFIQRRVAFLHQVAPELLAPPQPKPPQAGHKSN